MASGIAPLPLNILFVEDNDYLREVITSLLAEDGRSVTACSSGEEALAHHARGRFDVLVTDVSLPTMSGIDLARKILLDDPAAWVVISSGYAFDRGLESLGPHVRSLPKPFEVEQIEALFREIEDARERRF